LLLLLIWLLRKHLLLESEPNSLSLFGQRVCRD
jgi:hypothetical protein